ncbi:hypothetical protein [Haloactinomyces albus]|uniref:Membrane protein implicated in regulation of membrane protease activity n=1 Tax=Haloactinomyces albus TaxID=1352928 RepID=A0AAE3ZIT7_9ACTN|nr:hypothetical protein [Haloactinomyces albus]MDR7304388.1 membrane protein implicated in regulation of membrane protease activity [Haloactinomyces albus]
MTMTEATLPRRMGELALPGALVGALAGCFAAILAVLGGQPPSWAAVTTVTLALPLAVLGAGYSLLLATGTFFRPGVFAPAALYWFLGFPLARLLHELATHSILAGQLGLPKDPLAFLAFQALVSAGFAIGFLWLHERIMPRWLLRVCEHNPQAQDMLAHYLQLAEQIREQRARKQAHRRRGKDQQPRARSRRERATERQGGHG